jgi:hypothetical protein
MGIHPGHFQIGDSILTTLSDANCQANATGVGAAAVGRNAVASGPNS